MGISPVGSRTAIALRVVGLMLLVGLLTGSACAESHGALRSTRGATVVTHAVTVLPLGGRSLPDEANRPGVYVQLYRPHGALDFGAPLPFHYTVLNATTATFDPWELSFEYDGTIDRAWNASITVDGGRYRVRPEPWNAMLKPGEVRQFGFVGRSNNRARPDPFASSYQLQAIESEPPPHVDATGREACQVEVTFVVHADGQWWSTQSHSFFGEFYVRNVGTEPAHWALQWSMDHRGSSGPGTRSVNAWQYLVGGDYYVRSSSHEGPIEPGGTRSFAIWGDFARQPYDLVPCPQDVAIAPDPAAEAYQAAYDALTDEERRAVTCGSLVWNGTTFTIPSQLSGNRNVRPECR